MRTTRVIVNVICVLAAAGMVVGLAVERRDRSRLEEESRVLRGRLNRMDEAAAENQRLSNLVARANASAPRTGESTPATPAPDEQAGELVRLRNDVETLRRQNREMEALRTNTRETRAATEAALQGRSASHAASGSVATAAGDAQFEILEAGYWTDKTNLDVAAELRDRIRDGKLKAIASNNLKGDPDVGTVKRLRIVYRVGGAVRTNEFQEGEFVQLPKEQEP